MTREVEERIVAMKFDNGDFEKNAKVTIDTLDKLKDGLDFEDSQKSIGIFQKLSKAMNVDKLKNGIRDVKNNMVSLNGAMDKALTIGSQPFHAVDSFLGSVKQTIARVIGFDLATNLVSSVTSAFRQIAVQPIEAGFNEYELKMDSIKTIMSGSGESLQTVKQTLEELNLYADKTIYSFSDMTSNIGKFTNNGVALDKATTAMKGIANATADAGQGAQQASMAMYNISQAIGVGKMTTIDWKSIENANIATIKLKETMMEAAAANGKLVKEVVTENGQQITKYYALTEKEQKLGLKKMSKEAKASAQVTAKNFRDTLSKGWLDSDSMLNAFAVYSGDVADIESIKAMFGDISDEEAQALLKIGQEAMKAATEVRTFSKMWDALKESAQSGWAQSIELILGDMDEATTLWTDLNKIFDGIISEGSNRRKEVLLAWRGMEEAEDGTIKKIAGAKDGRQDLIAGIKQTIFAIQDITKAFGSAFSEIFGKLDGKVLQNITSKFKKFAYDFRNWLGITGKTGTRLEKIKIGLKGFFSIIKVGTDFIRKLVNLAKSAVAPIADVLVNLFEKVFGFFNGFAELSPVDMLKKLETGFGKLWNKAKSFFTVDPSTKEVPFVTRLKNVWSNIKTTFSDWMADNGFDKAISWLGEKWNALWTLPGFSQVKSFAQSVVALFKPVEVIGKMGNTYTQDAPIIAFFKQTYTDITTWWEEIKSGELWQGISDFLTNTWEWITNKFKPTVTEDENGNKKVEDSPVVKFLNGIWTAVQKAWADISAAAVGLWTPISNFLTNTWEWITDKFTPTVSTDENGNKKVEDSPVVKFLNGIWDAVSSAWTTISETGKTTWESVSNFLTNTWEWITNKFTPTVSTDENGNKKTEDSPVVKFLNGIWTAVQKAWADISAAAVGLWTPISNFLTNTWEWIVTQFTPTVTKDENGKEKAEDSPVVKFLKGVWEGVQSVWTSISSAAVGLWTPISNFLTNTWEWITDKFTPTVSTDENGNKKVEDSPVVKFLNGIWASVQKAWADISAATVGLWKPVATFLGDTWAWVTSFFNGSEGNQSGVVYDGTKEGSVEKYISDFTEGVTAAYEQNTGEGSIWQTIARFISDTFTWIAELVTGKDLNEDGLTTFQSIAETTNEFLSTIGLFIDQIKEFIQTASDTVGMSSIITFLNGVSDIISVVLDFVGNSLTTVSNMLRGDFTSKANDYGKLVKTIIGAVAGIVVSATIKSQKLKALEKIPNFNSIGMTVLMIGGGILAISVAFEKMCNIKDEDWYKGALVIGGIMTGLFLILKGTTPLVKQITGFLGNIGDGTQFATKVNACERILTKIFELISEYLIIDNISNKIGPILEVIGKSGLSGDEVFLALSGLAILFASIITSVGLMIKMTSSSGGMMTIAKAAAQGLVGVKRDWGTAIADYIGSIMSSIGSVFVAMEKLPAIIQTMGDSKVSGQDIKDMLDGISILVGTMMASVSVLNKTGVSTAAAAAGTEGAAGIVYVVGEVIAAIGLILVAFDVGGTLVGLIDDSAWGIVVKGCERIGEIFSLIAKAIGDAFRSLFGIKSQEEKIAEMQETIADNPELFSNENIEKLSSTVQALIGVAELVTENGHRKMQWLSDIAGWMPGIADDIVKYLNTITHGDYGDFQPNDIKTIGQALSTMFRAMNVLTSINSDNLATKFTEFLKAVTGLEINQEAKDKLFDIIRDIYAAIKTGLDSKDLPSYDATNVIQAILTAIGLGDTAIAYAVRDMVQRGLDLIGSADAQLKSEKTAQDAASENATLESEVAEIEAVYDEITSEAVDLAVEAVESVPEKVEEKSESGNPFVDILMSMGYTQEKALEAMSKVSGVAGALETETSKALGSVLSSFGIVSGESDMSGLVDALLNGNILSFLAKDANGNPLTAESLIDSILELLDLNVLEQRLSALSTELDRIFRENIPNVTSILKDKGWLPSDYEDSDIVTLISRTIKGEIAWLGKDEAGNAITLTSLITSLIDSINLTEIEASLLAKKAEIEEVIRKCVPSVNDILVESGWLSKEEAETFNLLDMLKDISGDETANSVTESAEKIAGKIVTYIDQINTAISNAGQLKVSVTPVIDLTNWGTETQKLESYSLNLANLFKLPQINIPNTKSYEHNYSKDIDLKLDSIMGKLDGNSRSQVLAINNVGTKISGVSTAFASMKVVLDTGVLVGQLTPQIDKALFKRSILSIQR